MEKEINAGSVNSCDGNIVPRDRSPVPVSNLNELLSKISGTGCKASINNINANNRKRTIEGNDNDDKPGDPHFSTTLKNGDMIPPKKPIGVRSSYSFFFKDQRRLILESHVAKQIENGEEIDQSTLACLAERRSEAEKIKRRHRKTHGVIGFQELAKTIAKRWKEASQETRDYYKALSMKDSVRYHRENMYYMLHQNTNATPGPTTISSKESSTCSDEQNEAETSTAQSNINKNVRNLTQGAARNESLIMNGSVLKHDQKVGNRPPPARPPQVNPPLPAMGYFPPTKSGLNVPSSFNHNIGLVPNLYPSRLSTSMANTYNAPLSLPNVPQSNQLSSSELINFVKVFVQMKLQFFPLASLHDISTSLKNEFGLNFSAPEIEAILHASLLL